MQNERGGFHIELKHMFILTLWISVVLGLSQLLGNFLVLAVSFYVVVQTILVIADRLMAKLIWQQEVKS